jgi:putative membrane protein
VIQIVRSVIGGFLMGAADLVPGVSGGTIALVLGIYERLVSSVREGSSALGSLIKADMEGFTGHLKRVEWGFLLPLLAGILTAVLALASLLERLLHDYPEAMAAGFFGLVLGSVVIAWRQMRSPAGMHFAVAAVVGVIFFVILGLGEESTVADPSLLIFFLAGALAICAMILPGISGSLILLLIGMYSAVLAAVNDRDFAAIGVFVIGAVVGLAVFSQILYWALRKHHDLVLAALVGLMAGSLRVLWPWPEGVESSALGAPEGSLAPVLIAFGIGLIAVFGVAALAEKAEEPAIEPLPEV